MPRLEGKRSNTGLYVVLLIVALLVILLALELMGLMDLIPNFGPAS
ncbi:MAG TPA: hypothetical protein VLA19_03855 [Herpetosiphonaceae bacterium]|uniref:Uncharacterized protein n=1 Tax=uncultured Chloroflexia bacterium TaxID=1672391 RepID=A0A6J4HLD2_9CHLR|nr:MAG: hypothetical protein AVDCRST_MAG26-823 [uncultured Chloroflexia bacterium]HSH77649.1 hypothetical protein [Herpetosiphonaceae bacterium]